jgi:hypothetical protein
MNNWISPADLAADYFSDDERLSHGAWGVLWQLTEYAPDASWSVIEELMKLADSDGRLAIIGAGPVEDLLVHFPKEVIARIEARARADSSFRRMLSAVWPNSIPPAIYARVQALLTDADRMDGELDDEPPPWIAVTVSGDPPSRQEDNSLAHGRDEGRTEALFRALQGAIAEEPEFQGFEGDVRLQIHRYISERSDADVISHIGGVVDALVGRRFERSANGEDPVEVLVLASNRQIRRLEYVETLAGEDDYQVVIEHVTIDDEELEPVSDSEARM